MTETNQLAQLVTNSLGEGTNDDLLGVAAFRLGEWLTAIRRLESLVGHAWANYYLAMSHHHLPDAAKAREYLDRANRQFDGSYPRGVLLRWIVDDDFPVETVSNLLLRDEAETLILGAPLKRKPFAAWLAEKRAAWEPVRRKIEAADWAARKHNYPEADRLYREIEQLAEVDIAALRELRTPINMASVAWALGQTNRYLGILEKIHAELPINETTYLNHLAEVPWALSPDLERRRKECWRRKDLEERWIGRNPSVQGEDALILGMLWYREAGNDRGLLNRSLQALDRVKDEITFVYPTAGKAFAAMAHWRLGNSVEARALLGAADNRFDETVLKPNLKLYQPHIFNFGFPACIMMEMVIKEADALIDPGVVNAPHVAALPPDGWPER